MLMNDAILEISESRIDTFADDSTLYAPVTNNPFETNVSID